MLRRHADGIRYGYYYKLPEGLFSLASDNADDDLLPKAFRVTPFFYVASKPRVFDHLFFDDGGKPLAVPLFYCTITQKHPEDATTGDKCCVMD